MQRIIVAEGIEIRGLQGSTLLTYVKANADERPRYGKASVWTYPKGAGVKAKYEVEVVYTMAEFAKALDTADAYVVYEGHSRYGQGPAFGPAETPHVPDKKTFPVNPWGVHFRMGYDATDTDCVSDILEHSVIPTEYALITAPAKAFLPEELEKAALKAKTVEKEIKAGRIKRNKLCPVSGAWRSLDICDPPLALSKTARGDEPLKGRHYYRKPKPKEVEYVTAVQVGSADLDTSSLKCKVLFMASCSSHVHFFKPLDKRRKAVKSDCKFYLTSYVCSAYHAKNFIEAVFKGIDPTSKPQYHRNEMTATLSGDADSGVVGIY